MTTPPAAASDPADRPTTAARPVRSPAKLSAALTRYRVMAFVTGGMLLVLCLEMILKYGFNHGQPVIGNWVAITHGWIYVVYLVTVIDLWSSLRWGLGRLAVLVFAGVVPFLSFFAEHRTSADVRGLIAARAAQVGAR